MRAHTYTASPSSEVESVDVTKIEANVEQMGTCMIDMEAISPKTCLPNQGGTLEGLMRAQRALMCTGTVMDTRMTTPPATPPATPPEVRYTLVDWQIRGRFIMINLAKSGDRGGNWYRGDQLSASMRSQWKSQLEAKPREVSLFRQLSNCRDGTGKIDRHIGLHVYGTKCDDYCELKFLLKCEHSRAGMAYDVESGPGMLDYWKPHIAKWWKRRIALHRQEGRLALIDQLARGPPQALPRCGDHIIDIEDMPIRPEDDESVGHIDLSTDDSETVLGEAGPIKEE